MNAISDQLLAAFELSVAAGRASKWSVAASAGGTAEVTWKRVK
jgi:hypothetical protein